MASFHALQRQLTAHLRDPELAPPPAGLEDRRLAVYRELFYNNVEGFLAKAFPVLRQLLADAPWHALVRHFFAHHRAESPLFNRLAEAFVRHVQDERTPAPDDPPYLAELVHYEWVELALAMAEDPAPMPELDPAGDLLEAIPVASPLAWTLAYAYPVHRISPAFQPSAPGEQPTYLVAYRNADDAVKFMEINALTARLMALMEAEPERTGRELLTRIASELSVPPESIVPAGQALLNMLRERGVVLGVRGP